MWRAQSRRESAVPANASTREAMITLLVPVAMGPDTQKARSVANLEPWTFLFVQALKHLAALVSQTGRGPPMLLHACSKLYVGGYFKSYRTSRCLSVYLLVMLLPYPTLPYPTYSRGRASYLAAFLFHSLSATAALSVSLLVCVVFVGAGNRLLGTLSPVLLLRAATTKDQPLEKGTRIRQNPKG